MGRVVGWEGWTPPPHQDDLDADTDARRQYEADVFGYRTPHNAAEAAEILGVLPLGDALDLAAWRLRRQRGGFF